MISAKNKLFSNFSALTAMQMVQYLAPLIVLPYLVRVIGPERFGIISFAHAMAYYFVLLPDLGMNLYAPREIALLRDSKHDLSRFVTGVLILKSIVLVLTLIAYFVMILAIPRFHNELWVFIFSAGYIIGESFIPVWFFQGIEKMVNITLGIFIIRLLSLVSIFLFVGQASDYVYVPLINSSALIAGVLFMYALVFFREGVQLKRKSTPFIRKTLSEIFPLFSSNLINNIYTGINVLVLGFLTSNVVLGYYAAAERLIKVGMGLLTQLSNVFYPHISRMLKISRGAGVDAIRTGLVAGMLLSIPAAVFTVAYAEFIVEIMLGSKFAQSIVPLRILGVLFIATGLINILGIQILLPLGEKRSYIRPIVGGFIIHLALVFVFAKWLQGTGAAIAFVIAQSITAFWMIGEVKKLSLGIMNKPLKIRLLCLALGLSVFSAVSWVIGYIDLTSIVIFILFYAFLVISLRLVDFRKWSVITYSSVE